MTMLGTGLSGAQLYADVLSVQEAQLSMMQRIGSSEHNLLVTQGNLAINYEAQGRLDETLRLKQDVYSRRVKLNGAEHEQTLIAANNYAAILLKLNGLAEARSLLRNIMPVAGRIFGESADITLKMRWNYAKALRRDADATLDDLLEAGTTLEDTARTTRRVLGGAHPLTLAILGDLRDSRAALRARETPSPGSA